MTTTAWARLPNAALIDRVIADVNCRPEAWVAAWGEVRSAARDPVRMAAWEAAQRPELWDLVRTVAWDAAWYATGAPAWRDAHGPARGAVLDAALALIAWDDAGFLLIMPMPALRLYAANGSHAAVLLLPAAIALGGES